MLGVGCFLVVMVPAACSIWPQTIAVTSAALRTSDPEAYSQLRNKYGDKIPQVLYYNKGL